MRYMMARFGLMGGLIVEKSLVLQVGMYRGHILVSNGVTPSGRSIRTEIRLTAHWPGTPVMGAPLPAMTGTRIRTLDR